MPPRAPAPAAAKKSKPFAFPGAIAKHPPRTRTSYFAERQRKLTAQAPAARTGVLAGVTVYFTGVRSVSQRQLEGVVWRNGGVVQKVWLRRSVTHVVADNLAASKVEKELRGKDSGAAAVVVRPDWILQSVEEGRKLPTWEFRVVKGAVGVRDVASYFRDTSAGRRRGQREAL